MSGPSPDRPPATPGGSAGGVVFTGSNGASDDGVGLLGALRQARRARVPVVVRGNLVVRSPVRLLSGDELQFDGATVSLGYAGNMFVEVAQSGVTMRGTLEVRGGKSQGFAGNGWLLVGGSGIRFDWHCRCSDFSFDPNKYLILGRANETTGGNGLVLTGETVTADSTVLNAGDWSNVDVSGVKTIPGGMSSPCPVAVINIKSDGAAGPVEHVSVHDCQLDGGGNQRTSGLVTVRGELGANNVRHVSLKNLSLRNMCPVPGPSLQDACDIIAVTDVTVDNVTGDTAFHGVGCIASQARISNVVFRNLNGRAVAVGDAHAQHENISDIVVSNCEGTDCGQSTAGPNGSGFLVAATEGCTTSNVTFENCRTRDTTGRSQPYGFRVTANGTVSGVRLVGGTYQGYKASVFNPSNVPIANQGAQV